jgi:hypothetical protein
MAIGVMMTERGLVAPAAGGSILAVAAAAVAASVLTLAGPVSSAGAAGSCHGGGCTGRDPHATGCDADAYTVKTVSNLPNYDKGGLRRPSASTCSVDGEGMGRCALVA